MRGNGEIAHAGTQKLAGPVAQLVIIVHLMAAFQSYPLRYIRSAYDSRRYSTNVNRISEGLCSEAPWTYIKDTGFAPKLFCIRERAGQEENKQHFVDNVVSWKSFFPPLERLFHCVQSSSEQDCLVREPQCAHGNMEQSLTSGISYSMRLSEANFLFVMPVIHCQQIWWNVSPIKPLWRGIFWLVIAGKAQVKTSDAGSVALKPAFTVPRTWNN